MNNILSNPVIQRMNEGNTTQISQLFTDIRKDTEYTTRARQRQGVYNRLKLVAASAYTAFGRGADGIPVYCRPESKLNNTNITLNLKCHKDYPNIITGNKSGYLSGFDTISTVESDPTLDLIKSWEKANQFDATFNDLVKRSCAYGKKALRVYNDPKTMERKVSVIEPWNYAPFYDEALNVVAVMQWQEISKEIVELYNGNKYLLRLTTETEDLYLLQDDDGQLTFNSVDYPALVVENVDIPEGRIPHLFKGVPVVEFMNNTDALGDVEKTLDMQDINDEIKAKASTEMSAFASVILVDKTEDAQDIDIKDQASVLRDFGQLNGNYTWLEKQFAAYPQIQAHYTQLEADIFESSNSYNPNSLGGDGNAPTAFQIKQKMKGLINATVDTESQFRGALLELWRLILTYGADNNNTAYQNLGVKFRHTIPEDRMQSLKLAKEAGYIIPQEELSSALGLDHAEVLTMLEEDKSTIFANLNDEEEIV